MKRLTLSDFIINFRYKFPEKKYNFKKSIYINSHTLMSVICDKNHEFNIRPCDLMNGYGCPYCGGTKKLTTEEFIEKANFVHNNFFNYDKTQYKNSNEKVIVSCPYHGDFFVKANNHLNGANCKKCSKEGIKHLITKLPQINKSTKKLTTKEFIEKAKEKWGEKYEYDENTIYTKNNQLLMIKCKEHGYFNITPNHFLSGRGCPICAKNKHKTTEEIINEIKLAQPYSDYDYSQVIYTGIHNNITLKCKKCGTIFSNAPSNLIKNKNGCPGCQGSSMENEISDFLSKKNILFEREKKFDWLVDKSNLRLDFYLPEYNIAIECQGIQHFENIKFNKNSETLEERIHRDIIKKDLCNKHNIKIYYYANYHLEFPYYVYESKENLLNDIISKF